jgi:hypothetical protein
VTLSASTNLHDLDLVTVRYDAFDTEVRLAGCQTIDDGQSRRIEDYCDRNLGQAEISGPTSITFAFRQLVFVPRLGRTVDCGDPAERCVFAASEGLGQGGSPILIPVSFTPAPARRLSGAPWSSRLRCTPAAN